MKTNGNSAAYFDYNATTPPSEKVKNGVGEFLNYWGNPSSIHWAGREAKFWMREARQRVAQSLGVNPLEIVFTSGGSEGNNSVIQSVYHLTQQTHGDLKGRTHFMCSSVEHPSVKKSFEYLKSLGARVDFIPVSRGGQLDWNFFQDHLSEKTALVSIMAANNEMGAIFPLESYVQKSHEFGTLFHTDAVQAYGKIPVLLKDWGVDFATFSAHKIQGLKGTGALYCAQGRSFQPLILGGGQERGRRGGTENTLGIVAMGIAAPEVSELLLKASLVKDVRDYLENQIFSEVSEVEKIGADGPRLPNTSSMILKDCDGESLLISLDIEGFAVSTGAACSSGSPEPSPVLLSLGLSRKEAQSSLRISLGPHHGYSEVDAFCAALKKSVFRLRSLERGATEGNEI